MKKSERLGTVLKLEEMKEQQAVKRFTDARTQLTQETQKLEQLVAYRREYEEMITEQGRQGIAARQLQSYHHFLNKLNQAISQQQQQLVVIEREAQQQEQAWLQQRGATTNMGNLVNRYAQSERITAERREQKEADERAQHLAGALLS